MKRQILFIALCIIVTFVWAQKQKRGSSSINVSGIVKGPDGVIAGVSVREIDNQHRIYNHTTTDRNGLFSFRVRDFRHSLQFFAPGYRTLSHKMLNAKSFRVTMEKRRASPYVATSKIVLESENLFCGHYLGETVRLQAWIEKMNDNYFTLILPVEMDRLVDEYPVGRQAVVLDDLGQQVMMLENVVDAYPIKGDPQDINYDYLAQSYTGMNHIPGVGEGETRFYAYPHFQISRAQMEQLCQNPELMERMVVDTYRANNYWNFFPTDRTAELFRKALAK